MRWLTLLLLLLASPAWAYQLHVRADDPGVMQQVAPGSIADAIDTVFDFSGTRTWQASIDTQHGTVTWGATLAGLHEGCMWAPNNTHSGRPGGLVNWRFSGVNGTLNRGGEGRPTLPLSVGLRADLGRTFQYSGTTGRVSYSYGGCPGHTVTGEAFGPSWGASSWVMVLDVPRTVFSMTLVLHANTAGERVHLEFWGTDAEKVGHQDIVDSPVSPTGPQTFAWVSTVPIAAVSMWPQNGPGVGFVSFGLGHATGAEEPVCSCPCECGG